MNYTTKTEILQDIKKDKKERNWKGKKMKTKKTEMGLVYLNLLGRAERMSRCGEWLRFAECESGHHKKLVGACFCRDRLCPMCNWRRSEMLFGQIIQILHVAQEQRKMHFLFLTLTVRNVKGEDLSQALDELFKGYNALFKYKDVDNAIVGWIRNLEVTTDWNETITNEMWSRKGMAKYYKDRGLKIGDPNPNYKTFHPHFHVLIGAKSVYYKDRYISQAKWTSLWQKAMRLDYTPSVHVQTVKAKKENQPVENAVAETAKYSVKDDDYIKDNENDTNEIMQVLVYALAGRRLIGFGKLFRDIRKQLHLKDVESDTADLVNADKGECTCPICQSNLVETLYTWHYGHENYVKKTDK